MRTSFLIFVLVLTCSRLLAQPQFISSGKIEFERKVNIHKQLDAEEDDTWRNMLKKTTPPVKSSYFDLYFDDQKTMYKPGREIVVAQKVPDWLEGPATDNIVYTDINNKISSSQKTVFESVFNITDTLRKIEWKITPDTRTIANFECRKATAIIMDSIYVIAFYTDQIITNGGPESFSGLPGMILGLAVPRLNTTWFATKLELVDVKPADLLPPKKGKKINNVNLRTQLQSSMKDWGKTGSKNIWQIMI
ncbi:MAG: GLPGLI family protein [Chitinophagaceae bacterium]|nr:GLPGLI family protein [Chitinophagaceae bacterium]